MNLAVIWAGIVLMPDVNCGNLEYLTGEARTIIRAIHTNHLEDIKAGSHRDV